MPGTIPVVNDLLLHKTYCYEVNQVGINNVYWAVVAVTGAGATLQEIATYLDANIGITYLDWLPATASYLGTTVQNVTPPITAPAFGVASAGAGTVAGGSAPKQLSGLIKFRNSLGGHANRGRIYVPFVPLAGLQNDGTLTGAQGVFLFAIAFSYQPTIVITPAVGRSTTINIAVFHRGDNTFSLITGNESSDLVATQRRRGDFGKTNPLPFI